MIDKRSSEATEAEATAAAASEDLSDSATGASTSSYNYYPPAQPPPPRYADFSSMVTSAHAQDKIGRSAQPKPGTDKFLHDIAVILMEF